MPWSWPPLFAPATATFVPATTLLTSPHVPRLFNSDGGDLASGRMPRGRRVVRGETRNDRVAGRAELGPLVGLLVSQTMRQQYANAVWYFVRCMVALWGFVAGDFRDLDRQLQHFRCLLWEEREAKSLAAHTVCGLQHFLNVRRVFPGAWRLYAA